MSTIGAPYPDWLLGIVGLDRKVESTGVAPVCKYHNGPVDATAGGGDRFKDWVGFVRQVCINEIAAGLCPELECSGSTCLTVGTRDIVHAIEEVLDTDRTKSRAPDTEPSNPTTSRCV